MQEPVWTCGWPSQTRRPRPEKSVQTDQLGLRGQRVLRRTARFLALPTSARPRSFSAARVHASPMPSGKAISMSTLPKMLDYHRIAAVPHGFRWLFRDWGGGADGPPARDDRGGAGARGAEQGGGGMCALGPVRPAPEAHGRLGRLPYRRTPDDGTGLNTVRTDVSERNAQVLTVTPDDSAAVVPRWTGVAGRDVVASTRSVLERRRRSIRSRHARR